MKRQGRSADPAPETTQAGEGALPFAGLLDAEPVMPGPGRIPPARPRPARQGLITDTFRNCRVDTPLAEITMPLSSSGCCSEALQV
jgi:hypothetical protein